MHFTLCPDVLSIIFSFCKDASTQISILNSSFKLTKILRQYHNVFFTMLNPGFHAKITNKKIFELLLSSIIQGSQINSTMLRHLQFELIKNENAMITNFNKIDCAIIPLLKSINNRDFKNNLFFHLLKIIKIKHLFNNFIYPNNNMNKFVDELFDFFSQKKKINVSIFVNFVCEKGIFYLFNKMMTRTIIPKHNINCNIKLLCMNGHSKLFKALILNDKYNDKISAELLSECLNLSCHYDKIKMFKCLLNYPTVYLNNPTNKIKPFVITITNKNRIVPNINFKIHIMSLFTNEKYDILLEIFRDDRFDSFFVNCSFIDLLLSIVVEKNKPYLLNLLLNKIRAIHLYNCSHMYIIPIIKMHIYKSVQCNKENILKCFLKYPQMINLLDNNFLSNIFIESVKKGFVNIVSFLLTINKIDPGFDNNEALRCACEYMLGRKKIIILLIKQSKIDNRINLDVYNYYCFTNACTFGMNDVISLLNLQNIPRHIINKGICNAKETKQYQTINLIMSKMNSKVDY
jgi:hypothetical protein